MTNAAPPDAAAAIRNEDLLTLRSYITAKDSNQYDHLASSTVLLDLTHSNLRQRHAEIRFDLHDTIGELRRRIRQKTGTPVDSQRLQILKGSTPQSGILAEIMPGCDDDKMLGYYSLRSGQTIHCVDVDPYSSSRRGAYEDTSLVEKYRMSNEEYDRRRGTLREWGRKQKEADPDFSLRKHAREHRELMEARRQAKLGLPLLAGFEYDSEGNVVRAEVESSSENGRNGSVESAVAVPEEFGPDSVATISPGARCEVQPGGRRGRVAFVGEVPEIGKGGYWVGVVFDEPVGKTDGTVGVGRKRYFDAAPGFGGFVRGKNIEIGDFPERGIMDELESDDEDEL